MARVARYRDLSAVCGYCQQSNWGRHSCNCCGASIESEKHKHKQEIATKEYILEHAIRGTISIAGSATITGWGGPR